MTTHPHTHPLLTPTPGGFFGEYGGPISDPKIAALMTEIGQALDEALADPTFETQMADLRANYVGRPSPVYHAGNLSPKGGAQIWLKREDLNHTGAHKINHCIGQVLLARRMGKKRVLAETGAGQHGVALATACALLGVACEIHMGVVDIAKEHPNVSRMKILGCKLVPVSMGTGTLKDAVDSAFMAYLQDPEDTMFAIGSICGPDPYPRMVQAFQSIVGREARQQFLERTGALPTEVAACVGGGSNAIGLFSGFMDDEDVTLVGVEPAGKGLDTRDHAATLTLGKPGEMHGFRCYYLQDENGAPAPVHSVASGLDYPGVGPQHCNLKDLGRARYESATDKECFDAFLALSRSEGIIPALESAHAVAYAMRRAPQMPPDQTILVNLSGRGDKDIDFAIEQLGL
ncbi:tryptophan synthase beta chain [Rhodovulum imhoffii]|uniref:Tryptophan synthase beta chain n=1 Tax=Rhodovulum imhoffii TaxID=365340 RepID=A0A2T5BP70_9RHOB|nr:tryptophan synthase subunit beta [Rhodovulum imhoffii]MBK5933984.1 tryptophan synthase subunit beta [Rhodovulum imhoffii]PTN00817.1 tryptophan synthase beta chain [Rhodovulum imhoffii]